MQTAYIYYTHEAKVCPVKKQLYSPNTPNYVCEQMLAQLRTGFILAMKAFYLLVSYGSLSLTILSYSYWVTFKVLQSAESNHPDITALVDWA